MQQHTVTVCQWGGVRIVLHNHPVDQLVNGVCADTWLQRTRQDSIATGCHEHMQEWLLQVRLLHVPYANALQHTNQVHPWSAKQPITCVGQEGRGDQMQGCASMRSTARALPSSPSPACQHTPRPGLPVCMMLASFQVPEADGDGLATHSSLAHHQQTAASMACPN